MPLPKPHKDEKEKDFITRCMGDEAMNSEFPENEQRAAVCHQQWRDSRKPEEESATPMQHKGYICKTEDANDEKRHIVSRISTVTVDRDKEVMLPGGMDITGYNGIVLWSHDYGGDTLPLGRNLWIKPTDAEIIAKTEFNDLPFSSDVYRLYRDGFLNSWSVGFTPDESREPTREEIAQKAEWASVRRIHTKWHLLEYSAVKVPSNPDALTLAISKGLKLVPELLKDLCIKSAPKLIEAPHIIPVIIPNMAGQIKEIVSEEIYKMRGGV